MPVEINYCQTLDLHDPVFIDVRSPAEYDADHIPEALNMPVFDDEERAVIGKLYRSAGEAAAVLKGTELAGGRVPAFFSIVQDAEGRDIVFYCARGGMRSTALVSLLRALGRCVYKLADGYKGYRRYVRQSVETLEIPVPMFTLYGLAGAGKTAIIQKMNNAIDLEEMAGHRSSAFGALGRTPATQKYFESQLLHRLKFLEDALWIAVEGESRRIGNIHIPPRLFRIMNQSPAIIVEASLEQRVHNILDDYCHSLSPADVAVLIDSISRGLGRKDTNILKDLLARENFEDFVAMLLRKYYDPLYTHSMRDVHVVARVRFRGADETAIELERLIGSLQH